MLTIRVLLPSIALIIAAFSTMLDFRLAQPNSSICRSGFCRFDQIYSSIDAKGMDLSNISALLNEDPLNPLVWCTYAELLSSRSQTEKAGAAFEHAITLGPGMSPVLMRAANFDFARGRTDHGFLIANRILQQTDAFDQILFSYLTRSKVPRSRFLGTAVPATPRPARSWLSWLRTYGSDQDLSDTWTWVKQNHLVDQRSAVDLVWTFWQRKSFRSAQVTWADWLAPAYKDYLQSQRLANTRFENDPNGSPFDWTLAVPQSIQITCKDGLDIRFSGTENVDFSQIHQFATVNPGRYRFSADIQGDGLTTDQSPYFHIFNPVGSGVNVQTQPIKGDVARSWIRLDFDVPLGTEALEVQIERHPSQHLDNKIAGTLHIYEVSLVPLR